MLSLLLLIIVIWHFILATVEVFFTSLLRVNVNGIFDDC